VKWETLYYYKEEGKKEILLFWKFLGTTQSFL
jgi:hypothetical protein